MKQFIIVRTQLEGYHRYENAPASVEFLRHTHRHIFHIEAKISVKHDNRELEFFNVKSNIDRKLYEIKKRELGSCEMIAAELIVDLQGTYGMDREYIVRVFEDNENGAEVCSD